MAFERVGSYAPLGVHDWRAFLRHKCEEHISVFMHYMLVAAYMYASHVGLVSLRLCFCVTHAEHICEVGSAECCAAAWCLFSVLVVDL